MFTKCNLKNKLFCFYILSFFNLSFGAQESFVKEITTNLEFENLVLKSTGLVILDFYKTTCPPCKQLAPKLEEMGKEFQEYNFYKIESAFSFKLNLIFKYQIKAFPTVILFLNGRQVDFVIGNSPDKIRKAIIAAQDKINKQ